MSKKFGGAPVVVVHFDKDYNITSEERYNLENFQIADWQAEAMARALLPGIRKYYEDEKNVQAFEQWRKEQELKRQQEPKPRNKKRVDKA